MTKQNIYFETNIQIFQIHCWLEARSYARETFELFSTHATLSIVEINQSNVILFLIAGSN